MTPAIIDEAWNAVRLVVEREIRVCLAICTTVTMDMKPPHYYDMYTIVVYLYNYDKEVVDNRVAVELEKGLKGAYIVQSRDLFDVYSSPCRREGYQSHEIEEGGRPMGISLRYLPLDSPSTIYNANIIP